MIHCHAHTAWFGSPLVMGLTTCKALYWDEAPSTLHMQVKSRLYYQMGPFYLLSSVSSGAWKYSPSAMSLT